MFIGAAFLKACYFRRLALSHPVERLQQAGQTCQNKNQQHYHRQNSPFSLSYTLCICLYVLTSMCKCERVCVYLCAGLVKFTHIVMESLGLAGMFTCLPPVRGSAVQIPEYTVHRTRERQQSDTSAVRAKDTVYCWFVCLFSNADMMTLS